MRERERARERAKERKQGDDVLEGSMMTYGRNRANL